MSRAQEVLTAAWLTYKPETDSWEFQCPCGHYIGAKTKPSIYFAIESHRPAHGVSND